MSRLRLALTSLTMLVVALLTLSVTPARAANGIDITLNEGTRSASIANLSLSPVAYSHSEHDEGGTMVLTADDSTGAGKGWRVTVVSSDFTYTGTATGATAIPAANFVIGTPAGPSMTAGQAVAENGPFAGIGGSLETERKVIYANANGGLGTYSQSLPITLTIPAQARAGTYRATLTVTISEGPGA